MRYTESPDLALDIPVVTDAPAGPNERHFEAVEHLPGLSEPEAAYEAGRALRMIGYLLDGQGSPIEHGQAFLSQLADAVLFFGLGGAVAAEPKVHFSSRRRRFGGHGVV